MNLAKKMIFALAIGLVPVVLSACIPTTISKGSSSTPTGEYVKGSVVKGFPANIPLYKGAKVIESYGNQGSYGATFTSSDSLSKVVDFYNKLPQLGWDTTISQPSATNFVYDVKGGTFIGEVIVNTAADGKTTAITVSLANR